MFYFLHGEDALTSGQKVRAIKEKFLVQDESASGLSIFPARPPAINAFRAGNATRSVAGGDFEGVISTIGTPNLLAPKRLIIINNLITEGSDEQQDKILAFLKKEKYLIEDKDVVVVFWEKKKPKKGSSLFKFLEKNAKSQSFEKPTGAKLNQWILKQAQMIDTNAKFSPRALEKLIFYTGGDLFSLSNEIVKLVNYASGSTREASAVADAGAKIVSEEIVDLLVQADFDSNIFNTIDALANRNKKDALKFLHQHLKSGDDPYYLLSMFVYQFRNLLKISDLKENYNQNEGDIVRMTKLHPFVVKKGLAQTRNFSFETLKKIYQKLSTLDTKAKTGQIDIKLALDKFVVEL